MAYESSEIMTAAALTYDNSKLNNQKKKRQHNNNDANKNIDNQ